MAQAYGIVSSSGRHFQVEGLEEHRPIGAFSFLGRYRIIDFAISNFSNSNIDTIQVYVTQNPRSLADHIGHGSHYNINSKRGNLALMFNQDSRLNQVYNTNVAAYYTHLDILEAMRQEYVILTPGYMVFKQNFSKLLQDHIASGADVTMLYHKVNNAKTAHGSCYVIDLNRQKGVKTIQRNSGNQDDCNIFMNTYVMKNSLFIELLRKAKKISSSYTLIDILNAENDDLDIRGIQHKGYFASISDLKSYFDVNLELLDMKKAEELITQDWPIYTRTTDSCPAQYFEGASVCNSMVANGCLIEGTVENSVIGRGVEVRKGAVVRNCVVLGHSVIDAGVHVENQVIDKYAKITHLKEVIADPEHPGYVNRNDVL